MNKNLHKAFACAATVVLIGTGAKAQRYVSEVFPEAQIVITPDVPFGANIDFLTSDFSNIAVYGPEVLELQTDVSTNQPIPPAFFNPADTSTAVKVTQLRMDIYQPHQYVDCETARPVVVYIHTGNALPPPLNGSPCGTRKDSTCVEICKRMARRGYVAVSMSYRGGWNPLGATLQERTGTLLNAIYRAIHDVKQCVRTLKQNAAGPNDYHINPDKIILFGEGTGGYIALATATLNHPAELFIPKFIPDPFQPTVSYVDTNKVGNIDGFGGQVNLYRPNGFDSNINFCVNMGGALADSSWLEPGDVPMVAVHAVFDPFAPFTEGIVIVPTTSEQVVEVVGSNYFMRLVNQYGNNSAFATMPGGDIYTDRARALYGTDQVHAGSTVHINTNVEGLYPAVTNDWPGQGIAPYEEASPWQWWDPNSALAQTVVAAPNITANMASLASNPNSSPTKGRAMIDTVMGYLNPRVVLALNLVNCDVTQADCQNVLGGGALPGTSCDDGNPNTVNDTWTSACVCAGSGVGIEEEALSAGISLFPNPADDRVTITSKGGMMRNYELIDPQGRRVRTGSVNSNNLVLHCGDLKPGAYFILLQFDKGTVTRKVMVD